MENPYKIYVHVGLPKSASSTLQHIFKQDKNINFLGIIRDHEFVSKKTAPRNEDFFHYIRGRNDKYKEALKIKEDIDYNKINVISDEDFTTSHKSNYQQKLKRLKNIFPKCKIIFILRNPLDILISWHNFHIRGGLDNKLLHIENYINSEKSYHAINLIKIKERLLFLENEFGKENLLIYRFSKLSNLDGQKNFLSEIFNIVPSTNFREIKKNISYSFLNWIYLKYPFIYKLKFILPKRLIKVLKNLFMLLSLDKLENRIKNKTNSERRLYLQKKYSREFSDYLKILDDYGLQN